VNFIQAEASYLPFKPNSFQTATMIGVLPYMENPEEALLEVHRVLTPFGQIEISSANANWINRLVNVYQWKYHFRYYSLKDLEKFLKEAGFSVRELYSRGRFIAPLLSNLFIVPNFIDKFQGYTESVIGPSAKKLRTLVNPIIQWEYDHHRGDGYQNFASGIRND
jgi:ubiquinone/menaquinone biosynthesis C-methylase UbiE